MKRVVLTLFYVIALIQTTETIVFSSERVLSDSQKNFIRSFGTILINVNNSDEFIEFELQNDNFIKTDEGKVIRFEKVGKTYQVDKSDSFKSIFNFERLYYYEMEEKIEAFFSQYNLEEFEQLRSKFIQSKGKMESNNYYLIGPGKRPKHWEDMDLYKYYIREHFIPNRQFSHIIYYDHSFAGVLIDLTMKQISFPFGIDGIRNAVWSKNGQAVAYSIQDEKDSAQSVLVIKDIFQNKTVLRKNLNKYPDDITWSPDSSYLAVLTRTARMGLWPWEVLFAVAGHPVYYMTFYLEIYDLTGNLVYESKIISGLKNGGGQIVWHP
jgi:hypothetical protein